MRKNDKKAEQRITYLVKSFIEQEINLFKKESLGYVKKYFRYVNLGNRITRKINAAKNGTFILLSKEEDVAVTIKKGTGTPTTIIEIKHNELCFKKDSNNISLKYY